MTKEETFALIAAVKEGNQEALDRLVTGHMGLCHSVASRFRDRGVEYEDLVQLAAIGMIKAIRSFDFSYSTAFSTYAVPLIIGEIRRFLRDDGAIKVGRGIKRLGGDAMRKREEFMRKHGREPKLTELSALCNATPEELAFALEAVGPIRSLNESVGGEDDGTSLGEMIADSDDGIGRMTDRIALSEAIGGLPPVQRQLIYLRYVKELSQAQTGQLLGMTQVKVSREEKKIIEALRRAL
ncbi:MAG: sigma-70 family RNA polymerase sigma factor [Ruminococcaceae bacterium]|nr:sigma-70 family RNA polymerase sigma factor [Oscillospiraceae bacterium]